MITNPAIDVLQRELTENGRLIEAMSEELKAAKAKQKSIEDALAVLTGQPISAPTSRKSGNDGPTLKEQIFNLLSPEGMGLSPVEIARLLTESGRETGNTTVSSTLSRMKKEGIVEKRNGKWFTASKQDKTEQLREQHSETSDWSHRASHSTKQPSENGATASTPESNTQRDSDPLGILNLKPVPIRTQD